MENEEIKKLREKAKDKNEDVRKRVAKNENTPPEVLTELAKDKNKWVQEEVAENESTPPEVLAELAKNKYGIVRAGVAMNESTPPEVLAELAKDESWWVRGYVAMNESTPPEVLAELAKDENVEVREMVARNENTPLDIKSFHLKSLLHDHLFNWLINGFVVGLGIAIYLLNYVVVSKLWPYEGVFKLVFSALGITIAEAMVLFLLGLICWHICQYISKLLKEYYY